MGEEGMTFERLNDRCDSIVATNPQVIPLGDVVGEDNARALADSGENG